MNCGSIKAFCPTLSSQFCKIPKMSEVLFLEYLNIVCSQLSFKLYGYIRQGQEMFLPTPEGCNSALPADGQDFKTGSALASGEFMLTSFQVHKHSSKGGIDRHAAPCCKSMPSS